MRETRGKDFLRVAHRLTVSLTGMDLRRPWRTAAGVPRFLQTAAVYRMQNRKRAFDLNWLGLYPILDEFDSEAGTASGHYFHQDLWAARKIFEAKPDRHLDVGSRVDGFVAHLLTFMAVDVVDIRPLNSNVSGLRFVQANATSMNGIPDDSIQSLSSLHAVEHFGLGRYGDPVEPNACFAAMASFARVLRPGGRLYFSVPLGRERVEFNAHRVFAPETILSTFGDLKLVSFSAVTDSGNFEENSKPSSLANARLACGLFEFTK
jgi:SAM-dependent methyltransferase